MVKIYYVSIDQQLRHRTPPHPSVVVCAVVWALYHFVAHVLCVGIVVSSVYLPSTHCRSRGSSVTSAVLRRLQHSTVGARFLCCTI